MILCRGSELTAASSDSLGAASSYAQSHALIQHVQSVIEVVIRSHLECRVRRVFDSVSPIFPLIGLMVPHH